MGKPEGEVSEAAMGYLLHPARLEARPLPQEPLQEVVVGQGLAFNLHDRGG